MRLGLIAGRLGRARWAAAAAASTSGALAFAGTSWAEPAKTPETPPPANTIANALEPVVSAKNYVFDAIYDNVIKPYAEPSREKLLPDHPTHLKNRALPTLVLDLDGCLIESTWTRQHGWRYIKRPGVDKFLASLAPHYELVLWTNAMNTADGVLDKLDPRRLIRHRLYRDTTTFSGGYHRKDLTSLNRNLDKVLIIDTVPESYAGHPQHGIKIKKYIASEDPDKEDRELDKLIPFLQYLAIMRCPDLSAELEKYEGQDIGEAFDKKLAELRASGKLRIPQSSASSASGRTGPTLWDRLRPKRPPGA